MQTAVCVIVLPFTLQHCSSRLLIGLKDRLKQPTALGPSILDDPVQLAGHRALQNAPHPLQPHLQSQLGFMLTSPHAKLSTILYDDVDKSLTALGPVCLMTQSSLLVTRHCQNAPDPLPLHLQHQLLFILTSQHANGIIILSNDSHNDSHCPGTLCF